jgi:hypothetical protein
VLTVKLTGRTSLRAAEGYARGILNLLKLKVPTPDHTTLSRRARQLEVELGARLDPNKRHVLAVLVARSPGDASCLTRLGGPPNIQRTCVTAAIRSSTLWIMRQGPLYPPILSAQKKSPPLWMATMQ